MIKNTFIKIHCVIIIIFLIFFYVTLTSWHNRFLNLFPYQETDCANMLSIMCVRFGNLYVSYYNEPQNYYFVFRKREIIP